MPSNMFKLLERFTALVEANQPDEAYQIIKDKLEEEARSNYVKLFVAQWLTYVTGKQQAATPKADNSGLPEIIHFLLEDFPDLKNPDELPGVERAFSPRARSVPTMPAPHIESTEFLTLTFYEWQMIAIERAAEKEGLEAADLLVQILETRNTRPLAYSRYRQGLSSPSQRITISIPAHVREDIEARKAEEGIKTTTRYVRKMLFGRRSEKF